MIESTGTINLASDKKKQFIDVTVIFLLSRVFFLLIMLVAPNTIKDILYLFDAEQYIKIANFGYVDAEQTAFFPLIPLILRYLGKTVLLIINNICFFVSLFLLKKLGLSRMPLIMAAFSPIGFFSMLLYTESIYFFITIMCFYLYREHKLPLLMGILLGIGVCTRNSTAMLFFGIFIAMVFDWINKRTKLKDIFIAYIPATLISLIYPIFLQVKFNNWKMFVDAQMLYWLRIKSNIFKTFIIQMEILFGNSYLRDDLQTRLLSVMNETISIVILLFLLCLMVVEIVTIIRNSKKAKKLQLDGSDIVMLFYLLSTIIAFNATIRDPNLDIPTASFYRYYASLFPLYLYVNKRSEMTRLVTLAITIALSLITAFFFCKGVYFY